MGNGTEAMTSFRRKSLVFHVISASGFAVTALARIGASLVGRILYARRTSASEGFRVIIGGIKTKAAQEVVRCGNFIGMFRSASSMICGEIIVIRS